MTNLTCRVCFLSDVLSTYIRVYSRYAAIYCLLRQFSNVTDSFFDFLKTRSLGVKESLNVLLFYSEGMNFRELREGFFLLFYESGVEPSITASTVNWGNEKEECDFLSPRPV